MGSIVKAESERLSIKRHFTPVGEDGQAEETRGVGRERADAPGLAARHAGVGVDGGPGEARDLPGARRDHAGPDGGGGLAGGAAGEVGVREGGDLEVEIDAVEQGTGEAAQVAGPLRRRTGAGGQRGTAAAAGVGGGDELEAGGEDHGAGGPRDDHARVREGLAERLEHPRGELGQLVQERTTRIR